MKVLLNKTKLPFGNALSYTLLIWAFTNVLGTTVLWVTRGAVWETIFIGSMLLSSPVLVFALPNFYILDSITGRANRILYAFSSVFIMGMIIYLFTWSLVENYLSPTRLTGFIAPFMVAAEFSFFSIARKLILKRINPS